jgi:hypothetical protein
MFTLRALLGLIFTGIVSAQTDAVPELDAARLRATATLQLLAAAAHPDLFEPGRASAALAEYAEQKIGDPTRHESSIEAARRVIAGGATAKRTPDQTSRELRDAADALLAAAQSIEGRAPPAVVVDLRIVAHLARFHSHRMIAAVRFNLFKRSLKLAELVTSVYDEKAAVAAWRDLGAAAGDRGTFELSPAAAGLDLRGHWRRELRTLEFNFRELEEQCCPPDASVMKDKVWLPAVGPTAIPPPGE